MSILGLQRDPTNNKIWSHVRHAWLSATPQEIVRQNYVLTLVNKYGFSLDQISEESDALPSDGSPLAVGLIIWRTAKERSENAAPLIIVQCKSDIITVRDQDYHEGLASARRSKAFFFVTHNVRETKYWRATHGTNDIGYGAELEDIPHRDPTDTDIQSSLNKPRIFKAKDFASVLHGCHNIIRNREKKDPAAAFDEMAKVLFVKAYAEKDPDTRVRQSTLFWRKSLTILDELFQEAKEEYVDDAIFEDGERIGLKPSTAQELLTRLESYNLADTRDDIKGVAFERFLGRTFRGEIGQFFTPRTIVDFMVRMVDPQEGEVVCDPACGSGGFLIRAFEIVRQKILISVQHEYTALRSEVMMDPALSEKKRIEILERQTREINRVIDEKGIGSRLWRLANRCIYGSDANDRMARISKMNMIMHGDGHGGVYHHDGFLDVGGILDGRFDIVLTNPPFGSIVGPGDIVTHSDVSVSGEIEQRNRVEYGEMYDRARQRLTAAVGRPIGSLFDVVKSDTARTKTEVLFIERCLNLLKDGGRLGIVLPEGIFNNPSLAYVREFVEERAFIRAVVSLPQETFSSTGASVKCSLLFLQKYTGNERTEYQAIKRISMTEASASFEAERRADEARLRAEMDSAKASGEVGEYARLKGDLRRFQKEIDRRQQAEAMRLLRSRFDYAIFMFEAEKVGITATGDEDVNELVPNEGQALDASCLERYREFHRTGVNA